MSENLPEAHDHDHSHDLEPIETTWTEGIHDLMLTGLTASADKGTFDGMGITVTVGGQTITGLLVGRARYFDALIDMAGDEAMKTILEHLKDGFADITEDDEGPHFLHLVEAHLVSGSDVSEGFGGAWRCKIGDVNAWSFGTLRSS